MEEVAGNWRRLNIEGFHNLCPSPSIIRVIKSRRVRWEGCVARIGYMQERKFVSWKPEWKRLCGKPRCSWRI